MLMLLILVLSELMLLMLVLISELIPIPPEASVLDTTPANR
jgi:hypothetical protein